MILPLFLPGGIGWRILTRGVDALIMACPRRWTFSLALRLARLLRPLVRRKSVYPKWRLTQLDNYREETLQFVVNRLKRQQAGFDPVVAVRGAEVIGAGGLVIASGHFSPNQFMIRWLHERGRQVAVVMTLPPVLPKIPGTNEPLRVIKPDATVLVEIRRLVAKGCVVWIALDTRVPRARRARRVETAQGVRYVSDTFMRFIERAGLPILFCATRVAEDGKVTADVVRPSSHSADALHEEFCRFLVAEAGR